MSNVLAKNVPAKHSSWDLFQSKSSNTSIIEVFGKKVKKTDSFKDAHNPKHTYRHTMPLPNVQLKAQIKQELLLSLPFPLRMKPTPWVLENLASTTLLGTVALRVTPIDSGLLSTWNFSLYCPVRTPHHTLSQQGTLIYLTKLPPIWVFSFFLLQKW